MAISLIGAAYVFLIAVVVPRAAFASHRALSKGIDVPPPRKLLAGALVSQLLLGALAVATAYAEGIVLFPMPRPGASDVLWSLALLASALALIPLRWRKATDEDKSRLAMLIPRGAGDLPLWVGVSLAAGVGEEIIYRGVLFQILDRLFAPAGWPWWPAATVTAGVFALGHIVQGRAAVGIVFVFALAFQALVWQTGDLYGAMAVHFTYDLTAGIVLWRLMRPRATESAVAGTGPAQGDG